MPSPLYDLELRNIVFNEVCIKQTSIYSVLESSAREARLIYLSKEKAFVAAAESGHRHFALK